MEIYSVGGYEEVGKNMTLLNLGKDSVVCDMGFHLPSLIDFEENGGDKKTLDTSKLKRLGAIPNDSIVKDLRGSVKAIVASHAHLDHIGGIPYLSENYNAPIIGSPYTIEVLNNMIKEEGLKVKNQIKSLNLNSSIKVSEDTEVELIGITHSIPQSSIIAVHTKKGTILYANDFKFDNHPILGKKPNYDRLKELGKENVIALVVESLYANNHQKTPSERVAREMLKDILLGTENEGHGIIVTSFASHIARLKSIYEFGLSMNRDVVFMGRSMAKYIKAAENINLVNFSGNAGIFGYGDMVKRKLKKIEKEGKENYLIICTGGQGEPGSVLQRMSNNEYNFSLNQDDHIIFSCRTIPAPANMQNRAILEKKLRNKKVRLFRDIHVSGHAGTEDLRDLIKMTNPQHIIPSHGDSAMLIGMEELAIDMGYKKNKDVHLLKNGGKVVI